MGSRYRRPSLLLMCRGWLAIGISAVGSSPAQETAPPTLPGVESPEALESAAARARAEAELAKARAMSDAGDDTSPEVSEAWLRHAEEAARLDPTWAEAAFERIWGLRSRVYYRHRGLGADGGERLHWHHREQLHEVWKALDDAEALEAFARWSEEHAAREVVPLRISWPTVEVLVEQKREHGGTRVITTCRMAA